VTDFKAAAWRAALCLAPLKKCNASQQIRSNEDHNKYFCRQHSLLGRLALAAPPICVGKTSAPQNSYLRE